MSTYEELLLDTILRYMESHLLFARRQITQLGLLGEETYTKMWLDLTKELNDLGQQRSPEEWQDFWKSLRLDNKQKVSNYLKCESSTGNLPNEINLTDTDVRISKIFGKFGTGLAIVPEFGIKPLDSAINPLDLFESLIEKRSSKPRVKKISLPINASDVSEAQKLELLLIMTENILYGLGEEEDVNKRNKLNVELVERLNALKGAKKDLFQWTAIWENMYRHCNDNSPSDNEFVNLVAAFKRIAKRNTNQRTMFMNKILKHVNDLKSKKVNPIKKELKKESDFEEIIILEDDENDRYANEKITGKKENPSMAPVSVPSTSRSRAMPRSKIQTESHSLQTVVHGDEVDVDMLKTIVESIVVREVKINVPDLVENYVIRIMNDPEFAQKMKSLLNREVEQLAEKLYLKWRTDEEQTDRGGESLDSNNYLEPLRDVSNHLTSTSLLRPEREKSQGASSSLNEDDFDLENVAPQEDVEESELPNASQADYEKEYDNEDFEKAISKVSTGTTKRHLPHEFEFNDLASLDRPTKAPQRRPVSPGQYFHRGLAIKENPAKLRAWKRPF